MYFVTASFVDSTNILQWVETVSKEATAKYWPPTRLFVIHL